MNRILIVDDEPNIRLVLDLILTEAGYEVQTASNGMTGLEILKQHYKPDVFIVDLKMPKLSGKDFVLTVRSMPEYKETPLFLLTGSIDGLDDFPPKTEYQGIIAKPFDLTQVLDLVSNCLSNPLLSVS